MMRSKKGTYPAPVLVLAAVAAEDAAEAADAAELAAADAAAPYRCSQFLTLWLAKDYIIGYYTI